MSVDAPGWGSEYGWGCEDEPRIVSPEEAQGWMDVDALELPVWAWPNRLAHTVATEPDRTRAAVVKALRDLAAMHPGTGTAADALYHAAAVENGAPL